LRAVAGTDVRDAGPASNVVEGGALARCQRRREEDLQERTGGGPEQSWLHPLCKQ